MKNRVLSVLLASCLLAVPALSPSFVPDTVCADVEEARTVTVDNLVFKVYSYSAYIADVVDKKVTSIKIPASVEGAQVVTDPMTTGGIFSKCLNLENFEVEEDGGYTAIDGVLFDGTGKHLFSYPCGRKGSYVIPEGTTSIERCAFCNAEQLTELTIPESVQSVGVGAFHNCTSLEEIHGTIKGNNGNLFIHCHALKRIEFAEATTRQDALLEELKLLDCPALEEVIIPKSRSLSGLCEIQDCGIAELVIPELKYHSVLGVFDCPNLKKVTFLQSDFAINTPTLNLDSGFTVYGYESNHVLQDKCVEEGIEFIPIEYQTGDIDGNEEIDITDVLALNQYLLGVYRPDSAGIASADVDHNGKVDDADALKILKSVVGLEALE